MAVIELSQADFNGKTVNRAKGSGGLVIFKADWCGHCKRTMPELEKVYSMVGSVFPVYKVDADKHPGLVRRMGVDGFPTISNIICASKQQMEYNSPADSNSIDKIALQFADFI